MSYKFAPTARQNSGMYNFCRVDVDGNKISFSAYDNNNMLIDEFVFEKE